MLESLYRQVVSEFEIYCVIEFLRVFLEFDRSRVYSFKRRLEDENGSFEKVS